MTEENLWATVSASLNWPNNQDIDDDCKEWKTPNDGEDVADQPQEQSPAGGMKNSQQQSQVDDQAQDGSSELNRNSGDAVEDPVKRAQDGAGADVMERLLRFVWFDYSGNNTGWLNLTEKWDELWRRWCNGLARLPQDRVQGFESSCMKFFFFSNKRAFLIWYKIWVFRWQGFRLALRNISDKNKKKLAIL